MNSISNDGVQLYRSFRKLHYEMQCIVPYSWRVCGNYTVCKLDEICIHHHLLTTFTLLIWLHIFTSINLFFPTLWILMLCGNPVLSYIGWCWQGAVPHSLSQYRYFFSCTRAWIVKYPEPLCILICFSHFSTEWLN